MKLHILNDLHIEFEDYAPPEIDADVVILAGDIGVGLEGMRWAESRFQDRPVIYVPGNHELYHQDIALIDELKAQAPDHIHVLNDDQVVIDGVRFLGSILWSDFALFGEADKFFATQAARQRMTDFSIIQNNGQRFTPEDAIRLHITSRDWLATMLAEPFVGQTVVVTHHAPSSQLVHPRYARDLLTPAFASNLEDLMDGNRAVLWIHGHMHESFDYEVYGTRVVCNPRGYASEALNPDFKPGFVVEINRSR
ncbi:MAG: metallophosphoesterase [Candidatus Thiodiazotropha sp.]